MKTLNIYTQVSYIEMADDNNVYSVEQEALPEDFEETIQHNGYYEGDAVQAAEEHGVALTKKEALELSGNVVVRGYGTHSGRNVWQLPQKIQQQISVILTAKQVKLNDK